MSAPIIVSALFADEDFHYLDGLRRTHFPPERNRLRAHLTMFHHLPPTVVDELKSRLKAETRSPPPPARLELLMSLGYGVALKVSSTELEDVRARLADSFAALLIPQDKAGWRPHVTIQNKASPAAAKALLAKLQTDFTPRPLSIAGLAAWYYRDGPWEPIAAYRFGSGHPMKTPPPLDMRLTSPPALSIGPLSQLGRSSSAG